MSRLVLKVAADGSTLTAIHNDALVDLYEEGQCRIARASHVEPTEDAQWTADMEPLGGPILGPFALRQEALDAEVAWIEQKLF
jgi:hypothetical protein